MYSKCGEKCFILNIYVKPRSSFNGFKIEENILTFYTSKSPSKGRVNEELIRKLSKALKISSQNIVIIRGFKAREKVVKIVDMDERNIEYFLRQLAV